MQKSLFEFKDYKKYLQNYIGAQASNGHGLRSRMATALKCHVTYVSQVLNKDAHLSLEQADELNSFLGHTADEARYFLLLVQIERAGTRSLKSKFQDELKVLSDKRMNLKERVDIKKTLSPVDQMHYYSSWHYSAIHILLTHPDMHTREAIAQHLKIPIEKVAQILEFLVSVGLVKYGHGKYSAGESRIFLGNDSPMISKHHSNWRMKSIESLDRSRVEDLHFSGVLSFASDDAPRIREILVKAIEAAREVVRSSKKEERLQCMNVDFFEI